MTVYQIHSFSHVWRLILHLQYLIGHSTNHELIGTSCTWMQEEQRFLLPVHGDFWLSQLSYRDLTLSKNLRFALWAVLHMTLRLLISFGAWYTALASECPTGNCDDDAVLMQATLFAKKFSMTQNDLSTFGRRILDFLDFWPPACSCMQFPMINHWTFLTWSLIFSMFSVLLDQFLLQQQDLFGRDIGSSAQHLHCDLDPQKYYTYTNHKFFIIEFSIET